LAAIFVGWNILYKVSAEQNPRWLPMWGGNFEIRFYNGLMVQRVMIPLLPICIPFENEFHNVF
jgi:hypothetical protein